MEIDSFAETWSLMVEYGRWVRTNSMGSGANPADSTTPNITDDWGLYLDALMGRLKSENKMLFKITSAYFVSGYTYSMIADIFGMSEKSASDSVDTGVRFVDESLLNQDLRESVIKRLALVL